MACCTSVIIIGGGLVGSLCTIYMAKRGFQVTLYEYREDLRLTPDAIGRSINLALSNRGRRALASVGLEDVILKTAIPMKGRKLHDLKGEAKSIPYDAVSGQCIYSVGRNFLNRVLLDEAASYSNVKLCFNHKLISANFDEETISVLNIKTQDMQIVTADFIIGADGAFSTLRRYMQHTPLFDFSQTYVQHGYLELKIPPENNHKMTPNHLHIWPRGKFMMIALPNQDQSWTVTLFMPFTKFESLNSNEKLINFYHDTFPDAIDLIGEKLLLSEFFKVKPSTLVSIKCNPYHVGKKFLLLGDAAHAMVPFYGQGMNAGFEDCLLLDNISKSYDGNFAKVIEEFSRQRSDDAFAICELALYNYVEMRDLVTKRSYLLRKMLDEFMFRMFPQTWIPLYNSVTFSRMAYKQCVKNRQWQDKIVETLIWILGITFAVLMGYLALLGVIY